MDTAGGVITLVDESTFAISTRTGDIVPGSAQGLFVRDKRVISRFELLINGAPLEPLAAINSEPYSATFVARTRPSPGRADSTLMIFRNRYVGQGMREDIVIHNYGEEASVCELEGFIDADFADLFAVKEGRAGPPEGDFTRSIDASVLDISYRRGTVNRGVKLAFQEIREISPDPEGSSGRATRHPSPPTFKLTDSHVRVEVVVPAKGSWSGCVEVIPIIESSAIMPAVSLWATH